MICPHCGHENIQGEAECAACLQDLTHLDEPTADSALERLLMEDPVRNLAPAAPVSVSPDTPVRNRIARRSVLLSERAPFLRNLSRGLSAKGRSRIIATYAGR